MTRESSVPGLALPYLRALAGARRRVRALDAKPAELPPPHSLGPIVAHPARLDRYDALCGFSAAREQDRLPATYPHLIAFPSAMRLMTDRRFPVPALGLVHLANRIEQLRPLAAGEPLSYRVAVGDAAPHARGLAVELLAEAADEHGETVWRSVSTYLHRSRHGTAGGPAPAAAAPSEPVSAEPSAEPSAAPPAAPSAALADDLDDLGGSVPVDEEWSLPADLGRRYAAVSGDRNPIHLHPLSARLFGFPRPLAHGMWTAARALAALDGAGLLPGAYRYDVDFRAPVLLPTRVRLRAGAAGLRLTATGDRPRTHLRGTITAL